MKMGCIMTSDLNPFENIEKIFHEPNRLSIMSALCASDNGMTFNELKNICGLTDGNLSRHLKVLEEAGAVQIEKKFVDNKPKTTIFISSTGLERFNDYLAALGEILKKAKKAMRPEKKHGLAFNGKMVIN